MSMSIAAIACVPMFSVGVFGLIFNMRRSAVQRAMREELASQREIEARNRASLERSKRATEVAADQFRAMLEQLPQAVIAVDQSKEIVLMNAAAQSMLHEGRLLRSSALPSEIAALLTATAAASEGTRRSREVTLSMHEATLALRVECVASGGLAIAVLFDLAGERDAERRMGEFVAKASHELRTPLASIRAYAEMLEDADMIAESERRQLCATMLSESDRLARMVDQMLSISRIESGIARISAARVDLFALATEAVDAMRGEASTKDITLIVQPCAVSATAEGDRDMLQQVLVNLISNGIKYTPAGGTVTLSMDTDHLARSVVVHVTDTGPGIPLEAKGRLFEKFYRIENYRRLAKGTGLGLNLCRSVIEQLHGGQIGVESTLGMGSRFWFSVPMERVGRVAA
ncbi:MAG: PAS domain-containing protein [Phycisphaerales bacterium]|nr:PAS domain-containing protein [Phycisphaerales bacterium]